MQSLLLIAAAILIVFCLSLLVKPRRRQARRTSAWLPYRKRDYLFSIAERSFYEVLERAAGNDFRVFAKVRLGDLVWMPAKTHNRRYHWYRIAQKHVDFVLCDPHRLGPVLVIELDDSSHTRFDRQERDRFVNAIMDWIGLPIWRVPVKRSYVLEDVAREIRARIECDDTWTDDGADGDTEKRQC